MFDIILSSVASSLLIIIALYLLFKERSSVNAVFSAFLILLASIEVAELLLLHRPFLLTGYERSLFVPESLLPIVVLLFGFTYGRTSISAGLTFMRRCLLVAAFIFPAIIFVVPLKSLYYAPDIQVERMLFLGNIGCWYYMGIMICCIIAMGSLEPVFRVASRRGWHRSKTEFIGIASILAILIFYFSQGLLYRSINLNLMPARSGIFILAALLIWYSRIATATTVKVVVSRYVLYRSLTMLFVGIYLIFLGVVGEGMKYLEIPFARVLTIFIFFIAGVFMVVLFLSKSLRRRVKVFVNKHFYAHKYDYREEWLSFTGRLALCRTLSDVTNVVVTTFMDSFGFKASAMYLFNKEKNAFSRALNYDMPGDIKELRISENLFSYFKEKGRVLDSSDSEYAPTEEEAGFLGRTGTGLVVALIANDTVEGLVLCGGRLAPEKFIYEDFDLMKIVARQATLSIVNFRLSEELAETREMAAVAKISSFIIHDLKNHAYTLSLLLENAEAHINNAEFQRDMIETVKNTVYSMKSIIDKLKRIPEKNTLDRKLVDLSVLTRETVEDMKRASGVSGISFNGIPANVMIDAEEIKKVIVNLLMNAVDATSGKGNIAVTTGSNSEYAFIKVADDGCGMTEEYIAGNLFKPFKSTKKSGLGIGLYQCRQIIEAHCGRIEVQSELDRGSVFAIYLSKHAELMETPI
jgi:putative PEP-CTERM system histidine kinase